MAGKISRNDPLHYDFKNQVKAKAAADAKAKADAAKKQEPVKTAERKETK